MLEGTENYNVGIEHQNQSESFDINTPDLYEEPPSDSNSDGEYPNQKDDTSNAKRFKCIKVKEAYIP